MPKITRRHATVALYQGNYEAELSALLDRTMAAQRREDSPEFSARMGVKRESVALAAQYDKLAEEARENAVVVDVWAISYRAWDELADMHPPVDGVPEDAALGVNHKTFPGALLRASLVDPDREVSGGAVALVALGEAKLNELGDLSRLHYAKLERGAWSVNVEDDALPKSSLVSLLRQANETDSEPQSDSE